MSKELVEALSTTNKLLAGMKRQEGRVRRLEEALEACIQVLHDIRYVTWPTEGLGIGLSVVKLDEALMEAERVLPKPPKSKKSPEKKPKQPSRRKKT